MASCILISLVIIFFSYYLLSGPRVGSEQRYRVAADQYSARGGGAPDYTSPNVASSRSRRDQGNGCPPCELYQRHMKGVEKSAKDAGLAGIVKHPLFPYTQGNPIRDCFCE